MDIRNKIINADAREALGKIPSNTIDCCITSPPYYGLRDYGVDGQIGLEETLSEYITKMVLVFREVNRIMKPEGTLWLNLGDSYCNSWKGGNSVRFINDHSKHGRKGYTPEGMKPKDIMGVPWRIAFALQADGWYLRQSIIWEKTNPMPESAPDRLTNAYEDVFLLSKSRQYWFDIQKIMEPCVGTNNYLPAGSEGTLKPNSRRRKGNAKTFRGGMYTNNNTFFNDAELERDSHGNDENENGLRRMRNVWRIASQGFNGAHFATMPEKLVERCLLPGCPKGGIVLDPFSGSGTVGAVAKRNGMDYLLIDINQQYCDMAQKRIDKTHYQLSFELEA